MIQLHRDDEYMDKEKTQKVIFKWCSISEDKKKVYAIVHPVGEPDMQSTYGTDPLNLRYIEYDK